MLVEDAQEENSQPKRKRRRRIWISIGIILALLIIFHRLILLGAIHWFAVHRAAQENLKLSFRAEGNVFTALTVRNLHLVPTGPAAIEIADAEYLHAEYSLFSLIRGHADFLESIEARNARLVVVVLNEQTRFSLINVDASRIREHMMTLRLVGTLDGAPIDLQASLTEQARSLFIKSHTTAHNLSVSSAKKLGLFSDAPVQGNIENFTFDFVGLLCAPKTWAASGDGVVRDLQVAGATFDRAAAQVSAHDGVATIQPVELTRAETALQIHGTIQLPERADDLGRSPAKFEVVGNDLDLGPITSAMEKPLSGHGQINGSLEIRDEQLQAAFRVASGPVRSGDLTLEKLEATATAEKNLRLHAKDEPWFEGLRANATAVVSAVRNSEFAADTISGRLDQSGSLITISNVAVQRGSNQIVGNVSVRLRADENDV